MIEGLIKIEVLGLVLNAILLQLLNCQIISKESGVVSKLQKNIRGVLETPQLILNSAEVSWDVGGRPIEDGHALCKNDDSVEDFENR